jgi:hypothetical protein
MSRVVTFGEIILRFSPPGNLRFSQARSFDVVYGGGEPNVAIRDTSAQTLSNIQKIRSEHPLYY